MVCVRGLKKFKNGCPQNNECPLWREMIISPTGDPTKQENKGQCIDVWMIDLKVQELGRLEGIQEAIERMRNAIAQPDPNDPFNDNKASPKPDPAMLKLINILQKEMDNREAIIKHEVKKLLIEGNSQ